MKSDEDKVALREFQLGIGRRLTEAREARRFATAAAFANSIGVDPTTYRAHEEGRGVRNSVDLYADSLHIHREWLRHGTGPRDLPSVESPNEMSKTTLDKTGMTADIIHINGNHKIATARTDAAIPLGMMPIFGSLPDAVEGWIMNAKAAGIVETPEKLSSAVAPIALYMMGGEMWPRLKDGAKLFLHPTDEPQREDAVVIFFKDNPKRWIARDLVDRQRSHVRVRKYGLRSDGTGSVDAVEYDIPWSEIEDIRPIV